MKLTSMSRSRILSSSSSRAVGVVVVVVVIVVVVIIIVVVHSIATYNGRIRSTRMVGYYCYYSYSKNNIVLIRSNQWQLLGVSLSTSKNNN